MFQQSERFGVKLVTGAFFGEDAFIAIDDKARHDALRNVWSVAFRRDTLQALVAYIRNLATEMLTPLAARLRDGETVDLVPGLCRHLPAYVIAHMLGVPPEMRPEIVRWSDLMAASTALGYDIDFETDPAWLAGQRAKRELAAYLIEQIRHRRKSPGNDLISQIVHSKIGASLSEEAIVINTRQLLFAGNETTANWLSHIALILARRPEIRREMAADRGIIPAAVEEMLRWEAVVQTLPRTVYDGDATIGDVTLPDGAPVVLLIGGANRDPERYADADRLDIARERQASLSFGYGMHSCLGVTLGRLEAAETTSVLLDLLPEYALADRVTYTGFNLRGPATLPVVAP
jgi:cytochrome P450